MPRCPECGEPIQKGQTHCFACSSDFVRAPAKNRFLKSRTVFIVAIIGGCIFAVVLALFIARPKTKTTGLDKTIIPHPTEKGSILVTPKEKSTLSDVEHLYLGLTELEAKIGKIESKAKTERFTRDEEDALKYSQKLLAEFKLQYDSLINNQKPKEQKRLIRQCRSKQNEINEFLFILKNRF